ncbi:hypothetical protein BRAS3843_520106 [Bradyrhizobium sp. STM 3843]|nr:hypothetical protein BRAS3843_520106 [Bradyrhizobium sp. STM 3843]
MRLSRTARSGGKRGDVDDPSVFARLHMRHYGLGHLEDAARVHGERLVPSIGRQFLDGRQPEDPRIVDEDIDVPETLHGISHGPPAIVDVADIAQHWNAAAAKLSDLSNSIKKKPLLGRQVGQRQIVAAPRKTNGYRAPNSATCSSHDRMSGHVAFSPVVRMNSLMV